MKNKINGLGINHESFEFLIKLYQINFFYF